MGHNTGTGPPGERLDALVSLLAHDLGAPLGPLTLALSLIAEDQDAPEDTRELARLADAQARRIGRLMSAAVASVRGVRGLTLTSADAAQVVCRASATFESLGGTCEIRSVPCAVRCDAEALHDALVGLMESVAGEGGRARVWLLDAGSEVEISVADAGCPAGTNSSPPPPGDARVTLAEAASAVLQAHGGRLVTSVGLAVASVPRGKP